MTVQISQDQQYIELVRVWATFITHAANVGNVANMEWNNLFGGASRLTAASFLGDDEGLDKDDISAAKDVLYALNAWLDGDSRRASLMAVIKTNMQVT